MLVLLSVPFLYGYHTAEINDYPMYNDTDGDGEYDAVVELSPDDCFEMYDRAKNPEVVCPKKVVYQRVDHGLLVMVLGGLSGVAVFAFGIILAELFGRYLIAEEAGSG